LKELSEKIGSKANYCMVVKIDLRSCMFCKWVPSIFVASEWDCMDSWHVCCSFTLQIWHKVPLQMFCLHVIFYREIVSYQEEGRILVLFSSLKWLDFVRFWSDNSHPHFFKRITVGVFLVCAVLELVVYFKFLAVL